MACGLQVRKHDVFVFGYLTEESLENGEVNYSKKKKKKYIFKNIDWLKALFSTFTKKIHLS